VLGVLAVLVLAPAHAGFDEGLAAYRAGDYADALAQWLPLAESGVAEAQFNVGLLYHGGKGVGQDRGAAAAWYRRAADLGYARAQYALAVLCESGDGIDPDPIAAFKWFALAGREKYEDARKRRKRVARTMDDRQIALAELEVREWLRRQLEAGR
jgi:TPR repeat protein